MDKVLLVHLFFLVLLGVEHSCDCCLRAVRGEKTHLFAEGEEFIEVQVVAIAAALCEQGLALLCEDTIFYHHEVDKTLGFEEGGKCPDLVCCARLFLCY